MAAALLAALALVLALRPAPAPATAARPTPSRSPSRPATSPAGTVLTAADLAVARYPPDRRAGRASWREPDRWCGRVLAGGVRAGEPLTDARLVGPGLTALLPEGQVAAPVRLADLAVAALVRTGDRVDVLATAPDAAAAEVVAAGALVLRRRPAAADDPGAGLLLLAVDAATAARLAAAATTATLTVSLPPP